MNDCAERPRDDPDDALLTRVRARVSNVAWPALPGPAGASMLALQFQLERSQWWPSDTLARHQHRQLAALLDHARRTVPFYEDRLAHLDCADSVDPHAFAALPTLSRAQIQTDGDALRSRAVPPDHGGLLEASTTGSTGRPIRVVRTQVDQFWWGALLLREHLWHRRDLGGKLASIRTNVKDDAHSGWGPATDIAFTTGPATTLNAACDIAEQARWLAAEDPDYLNCHPSNLLALARHCQAHGIRPRRLREVRTYGEALPADLRAACARAWGVPLVDCYSTQEIGYVALQCPAAEHYHVQSEHVLVEVLNDANQPCAPGEIGRVVATGLHNYAMPLIRYELYDYAEVGAPCPCGRGLPVLTRVLGRRRNLLHLPDGTRHWPSFPAAVWLPLPSVRQFQLVQTSLDRISIRLVADRPLGSEEARGLFDRLSDRLGWRFEYHIEYVEPFPGGAKFEDFVSLVDTGA